MSRKEDRDIFVIVAFRYDEVHSKLYKMTTNEHEISDLVFEALRNDFADFISIRRVHTCQPQKQNTTSSTTTS